MTSGSNIWYPLIIFMQQQLMTCGLIVCIAFSAYLFAKAVVYEESVAVLDGDEEQRDQIQEIHDKVCQIFNSSALGSIESKALGSSSGMLSSLSMDHKSGSSSQTDKYFKNTKVVVWLTNRPIEEEKHQRKQFFKKLNQQVQQAFNVGLQSLNPFASKAAAQQQDDVNEASMLS